MLKNSNTFFHFSNIYLLVGRLALENEFKKVFEFWALIRHEIEYISSDI